ncbi:hypothetical protein L2E82_02580 [Cichorium intybus]|uniref:Uncharacterized protein n=1 Tax=Cichorium intybus TaxID=13427 RepID=A0ACB9H3C5_CICIN|nr:hypothetical protein L2E82_02580 [Cichorium intybus]
MWNILKELQVGPTYVTSVVILEDFMQGEEYKLFWPDHPEFVRMAAKFGAVIVPFGVVGEDDITELVLDYGGMMKIPVLNNYIKKSNKETVNIR